MKRGLKTTLADHITVQLFTDPHVRIVGRKEDVLRAKDKVMAVLDAKVSDSASSFFPTCFSTI